MVVDGTILLILLLFAVRSFQGGIQGEVLGTIGWLFTLLLAFAFTDSFSGVIDRFLKNDGLTTISGYLAFLLLILFVRIALLVFMRMAPAASNDKPAFFLRMSAAACGLFRGAFFISVVLLMVSTSSLQAKIDKYADGAIFYPKIKIFSRSIVRVVIKYVPKVDRTMQRLTHKPLEPQSGDAPPSGKNRR